MTENILNMRSVFFFIYTATNEIYTYCHNLPLHDAIPSSFLLLVIAIAADPGFERGHAADCVGAREHRVGIDDQEVGAPSGHQRPDAVLGEARIGGGPGEAVERGLAAHRFLGAPAAAEIGRATGRDRVWQKGAY